MKAQASAAGRIVWAIFFVVGLLSCAVGVAFWLSGPDMLVPTVLFAVPGAFIVLESAGRMLGWEK